MIDLIILERIKKWVTLFNNPCQDFFNVLPSDCLFVWNFFIRSYPQTISLKRYFKDLIIASICVFK